MKKCLVLLLALVLVLSAIPALEEEVKAECEQYGGVYYYYSVSDSEATITDASNVSGAITLPSSLGGYPVASIGDRAFYYDSQLTEVIIPDGIATIGYCAFGHCDSLTTVIMPDSITEMEAFAFRDCSNLAKIALSNSMTYTGNSAFYNCDSLTDITIPDSVTEISGWTFYDCDGLTGITIPQIPILVSDTGGYRQCQITDLDFYIDNYDNLCVKISGTCTNTQYPNTSICIEYKVYDSNQVVIASGHTYTTALDVGDKFIAKNTLLYDVAEELIDYETYRFVLVNATA